MVLGYIFNSEFIIGCILSLNRKNEIDYSENWSYECFNILVMSCNTSYKLLQIFPFFFWENIVLIYKGFWHLVDTFKDFRIKTSFV